MTDQDPLVPEGAAFCPVENPGATQSYAFILVPGFTFLAFASAIEPLRIANQLSQRPLYRWSVQSELGQPVASSAGITVTTDGALYPVERAVRLFVCAGNPAKAATSPAIVTAVERHYRFGGIVGGICTRAFALARASLLTARRFTLHWENQPGFAEIFPGLTPTSNRFETDGRVITCGGGAASTDMMLSIIAADHGPDFAAMVSEMCLRTLMSGTNSQQRSSAGRPHVFAQPGSDRHRHLDEPPHGEHTVSRSISRCGRLLAPASGTVVSRCNGPDTRRLLSQPASGPRAQFALHDGTWPAGRCVGLWIRIDLAFFQKLQGKIPDRADKVEVGAGLGTRLGNSIRLASFPKSDHSLNAAALVWSNAPVIIGAHDTGPLIRSKNGFWLAIPTHAAGKSTRGGRITPGEWVRRTGLRLRFIYRRRGPSLLVAERRLNTKGRAVASKSKTGRGVVTATIFLLVPQVKLPKRLDLARDAERAHDGVPGLIVANWVGGRTIP